MPDMIFYQRHLITHFVDGGRVVGQQRPEPGQRLGVVEWRPGAIDEFQLIPVEQGVAGSVDFLSLNAKWNNY
jgi:hypothetical protein